MTEYPLACIIPCFNPDPEHLRETLASLAASTFHDFQLILVDDGSADPSFSDLVLDVFPKALILRHSQNRGLSAARNTGVAATEAPYFLQLDADDLVEPTFIEKALWALETHPQWAFCNAWHKGFGARDYDWKIGFESGPAFLGRNQVAPTTIIRRAAHEVIGGYDETLREGCEDWDYWLNFAAHAYWGGTLPEFLIRYHLHSPPTYWPVRDDPVKLARFRQGLLAKYQGLNKRTWPKLVSPKLVAPQPELPSNIAVKASVNRNPKHILLVTSWLTLGGADRFNLVLIQQLRTQGYTITLCCTADGPSPWLSQFAAETDDIFILRDLVPIADYPRFLRYLLSSRPIGAVVVAASTLGYGLLPYLRSLFPEVTFVDYLHMVDLSWRAGGYARATLNQKDSLGLTLTSSQHARDWLIENGTQPERVEVCYTNVDTDLWNPDRFNRTDMRRAQGLAENTPVILYAARLAPQKRPRLLMEILLALHHQGYKFQCLIAGDGPEFNWVARFIRKHHLQSIVRLLGAMLPDQMPELMAASDIFLLPSACEGLALTLYEAMAMALPVVAAEVGGQAELVVPGTGFLVPRDESELGAYIEILSQLLHSPELRRSIGTAARERVVTHFSLPQMMKCFVSLLDQATDLHQQQPRPVPTVAPGWAVALNVIAAEQQEALAEKLFAEKHHDWTLGTPTLQATVWQRFALNLKRGTLYPLYSWGLSHGLEWLLPLKNRLYRVLGANAA